MGLATFDSAIAELFKAITLCASEKLVIPSITLLYSGIDMLGWLDIDDATSDATGQSFRDWCETYLLHQSSLRSTDFS